MFKIKKSFLLFLASLLFMMSIAFLIKSHLFSCDIHFICPDGNMIWCQTFGDCGGNEACGYYRYYSGGPIRGVYCQCSSSWWGSYCEVAIPQ